MKPVENQKDFKPLFTTINRPLTIARPENYLLSRTQSTSGIATKKALELKKKYLLGPQINSALQKSDSASELNSKFKEFHSNISECQKLLNPASDISPSMQAFLENASRRTTGVLLSPNSTPQVTNAEFSPIPVIMKSPNSEEHPFDHQSETSQFSVRKTDAPQQGVSPALGDIKKSTDKVEINSVSSPNRIEKLSNKTPQSPVFKIDVPEIPWSNIKKTDEPSGTDIDSDSLYSMESSSDDMSNLQHTHSNISVPRVEIMKPCGEVMQLDSLMMINGEYIGPESDDELGQQTTVKCNVAKNEDGEYKVNSNQPLSSSDSGNDITAFFTDNESLDWAVEGSSTDALGFNTRKISLNNDRKQYKFEMNDESEHVCGKENEIKQINLLERDHSDIEFMDTGSEESLNENDDSLIVKVNDVVNTGFVEFVDINVESYNNKVDNDNRIAEAINEHCASNKDYSENYTSITPLGNTVTEISDNKNCESEICHELNNETEVEYIELETQQPEKYEENTNGSTYLDSFDNNDFQASSSFSADNSGNNINNNELNLTSIDSRDLKDMKNCKSPKTLRKLEEISKEKEKQKDLIYQLVMDKMSKRSDRKERRCKSPVYLKDDEQLENKNEPKVINLDVKKMSTKRDSPLEVSTPTDTPSSPFPYTTSFKLLSFDNPKPVYPNSSEAFSLPDIHQSVKNETQMEKLKNIDGKIRKDKFVDNTFEMSYNYPTGIVPGFRQLSLNDFSGKLVQHVESLRNTTDKETNQPQGPYNNMCVSDPNFFSMEVMKKSKTRDGERRKSIIKTVSDFFTRKRESPGNSYQSDDRRGKICQKSKSKSQETTPQYIAPPVETPPPIPPLPTNYTNNDQQAVQGSKMRLSYSRKRCKSLNELQMKQGETEQTLQKTDMLLTNHSHKQPGRLRTDYHSGNCSCLNKYSENLKRQRDSQSLHDHEMFLQQRHEELRLQLRDLYNAGNDIDHERESAIINEMMAIVTERQTICMSKNQRKL